MKHALRLLFILGISATSLLTSETYAQCPVTITDVDVTDVSCSGANDGEICITVSGGFPNYTYQVFNGPLFISSGQQVGTTYCFTGLGSGVQDYQIIVVGENGSGGSCPAAIAFATINDPDPFDIQVTVTPETCPDSNDGTASVAVSGGSAPYTYSWPPFPNTGTSISGLDGGNYSVIVTDNNGCSQAEPFTIATTPDWAGTFTPDNPDCFGGSDGSITSSGVTGGVPPYTFSWTNTAQTTETITGLTAGSYTLTATDATGCTHIFPTVTLTQPAQIVLTETHVNVSCTGQTNGSINVSVSGGTSPYTYLWSNGATTQDLTGLVSGNYVLNVTDANGCNQSISVTILDGSQVVLSSIAVNSECNESTGSIDLTVTGGSGNYAYSWAPGGQTSQDLSGLSAGIYDVTVTDNTLGCTATTTVIVNDFPAHDIAGVVTDGSNCVSNDGSIDITVTGGSGDFSYLWSNGPTTQDVSGLATGTYFVTVTDNVEGCVAITSFTVQSGNPVLASTTTTDPSCGLINGAIDLTPSGGTAPYAYSWSTGASTQDISGLGAGIYTVTVTDVNGCTFDGTFTLSNQGAPVISATTSDPSCPGGNDGSIALSLSGGTGPFSYSWSNGGTTATQNSLYAATYTVTVTDQATGCTANASYTLTNPPSFSGSVNLGNVSCGGANDGFIDLSISGGTLPYSFLWTPGNITTEDLTNLGPGNYNLTFTDGNGCSFPSAFTITSPPTLVVTETHQNVSCNGANDGSINVSVSGGTPPFNYAWLPGGQTTQDLSGLAPGTYDLTVTDAAGCTGSVSVTIIEPLVLSLTSSSSDATCNGTCDGSATVTPVGGTGPFTFAWTPNVGSTGTVSNLCAGSYSVVVTDANGCQQSASFTIDDNQIQASVSSTNVTCNGTCDGTASATVTGNNPPFTYSWSPSGGSGPNAIGLCAGTYTLTVTDNTGCSVQQSVTITEPTPITISMAVTDVSCEGASDGAIDLTVSGGTAPYTYQWFPGGQTTEDLSNIPAGTYSVVVTDANGCTSSTVSLGGSFSGGTLALPDGTGASYSTSISITGFPTNAALTDVQDFDGVCVNMEHSYLGDLDIQLTCPNGTVIDLYQSIGIGIAGNTFLGDAADDEANGIPGIGWDYCWTPTPTFGTMGAEAIAGNTVPVSDGNALPPGDYTSQETLSNLIGCPLNGTWTITVTDNFAIDDGFIFDWNISLSGSGANDSLAVVNEPGPITISSNVTDATCGVCDGSVTITPAGGSAPYTYLWNTGATTATITSACAGVYNVIVTDANGCSNNFFVPVDNTTGPTGANVSIVDESCPGACDGEATVTGIGGNPPYNYQWVPGGFNTSNVIGLCDGTYNVQIQDADGCIYTEPVTIGQPTPITFGQTITNSTCGLCTGQVTLTPITGVAPFTYSWSPSVSSTNSATGLCAGVYAITVTDATGCSQVVTALVNDIPSATLVMSSTDASCNTICDGTANVIPLGGASPFTYLWDDPAAQTTQQATGLCEGLYTVTVTDVNGCIAVNQISLDEPDPIGLSLLIIDNGTCAGNCDGSITVIPSGGTIPFSYVWDDPATQTTATASNLCAGTYTVQVTDANGCSDVVSGTVNNPVGLTATTTQVDVTCNGLCDGSATVTPVGGTAPYTYLWDDPAGQTTPTASNLCAGNYTVTVTDANLCDFIAPVTIAEPSAIVVTISNVVNLQCSGTCIGEATATASGGVGPYTYLWSDPAGQTTQTATGLCASTYTVTVTDANGCTQQQSVTITGPNGLTSSVTSSTNVLCFGQCNGTATVTATGGTAPYTYQWNDPSNQTTQTATGLCAGTYGVTVTDANGCVSVSSVVITQPALLVATTTANDVTCFGSCDATASVFVTGGTAPYTYQWNDPANQTTVTAIGLCAGTYTVTVTGTNGCVATATETIFQPPTGISIDTLIVNATCGQCNGEITVTPQGGVAPYTYLWGDGQTTDAVTGLCPGIHTVDVTDNNGCTVNFDIAVSNDGGPTNATVSTVDASCYGTCDGEGSVTPVGGIPPYTYLWVPGGQTTAAVTGLCAGTYNVQISDSLNCIYTAVVTINEPAQIIANTVSNQSTCGQCDGQITMNPTGGDGGPYTYSWVPNVSNGSSATGLCAGIYTITITDASGCQQVEIIPIGNIDGPSVTATSTDATCNGTCDGTGTVAINGGTAPFTILWDDPSAQTTATATGLCAGIYNATVTDANGCVFIAQVEIEEPDAISLSLQLVTDASCPGACDGSATVLASGGSLPYAYSWAPGGFTGSTVNGLCAGTYTVTVTDANGCTQQQTVTVDEPAAILINTSTLDASCNGICDGEAYAAATGGSGGFTYLWNDQASTANDTVVGLCAGTYQVVVTDVAGCTDSTTVTINEPAPITIAITPTPVSCNGDCDGSALAVASGGNGPYTYQWNDPASTNNDLVSNLCPGIYGVVVTDANGCTETASTVITEPLPLTLQDSVQNITCGGSCDGIAGVLALGGTAPYTYQWNDPLGQTLPIATGLCAGTYTVTVTDANGCVATISMTITEPPVLDAPVTVQNPSCGGVCDGSATVSPSGGTPPYTILWLPGLQTSNTVNDLCAGNYTVLVVDANGCADSTSFLLTEPPVLTAQITSTVQVLCSGSCSGQATVTATGGTPPYTYQWNDPASQTTQTATGLCVGTYSVTITDGIGCTALATVVIDDSNALSASVPVFTSVSCNGDCDGTATVFANGGTGPYSYFWNDQFNQTTQTAANLCAGVYTVTVIDAQSPACTTQAQVIITEPLPLSTTAVGSDLTCGNVCDGTATAVPVGGTAPYIFSWNNGQVGNPATNLCVGTYTVLVTDANGCTAQASVTVSGPPPIISNATSTASSCSNVADGTLNLTVVGGVPGYSYNWVPGNFQTEDLNGVETGTYTVTITDVTGCQITATYSVGTFVNIDADAGQADTVCIGAPITLNGTGGGTYLWSPAATLSDPAVQNPTANPTDTTTYYLTVTIGGCVDVDSVTIYTYQNPPVDAGSDLIIPSGGSIGLNALGIVTGWEYTWEPTDLLDNPTVTNPLASPDETTMFYVTVTDLNGCTSTDSVLVEVTPGIVFPDGITPNGDGINDTWIIDNIQLFPDAIVEVYNRWGQQLFVSAPGYPVPWDGKYKGKDLPVGTYYYVIHSDLLEEPYTGPLTIVR